MMNRRERLKAAAVAMAAVRGGWVEMTAPQATIHEAVRVDLA